MKNHKTLILTLLVLAALLLGCRSSDSQQSLDADLRASGGYLSGDPYRLHFGFPAGVELRSLTVIWPDGQVSKIDQLEPQTLVKITR